MPTPFQPLPNGASVFRLVSLKAVFIPEGALFPVGEAFRPSSDDHAEALRCDRRVSVSVWNRAMTTVDQACAFRHGTLVRPYLLNVDAVRAISEVIDVVEDPLLDDIWPGADAHCGILGLDRNPGESKGSHRNRLEAVAELAVPI